MSPAAATPMSEAVSTPKTYRTRISAALLLFAAVTLFCTCFATTWYHHRFELDIAATPNTTGIVGVLPNSLDFRMGPERMRLMICTDKPAVVSSRGTLPGGMDCDLRYIVFSDCNTPFYHSQLQGAWGGISWISWCPKTYKNMAGVIGMLIAASLLCLVAIVLMTLVERFHGIVVVVAFTLAVLGLAMFPSVQGPMNKQLGQTQGSLGLYGAAIYRETDEDGAGLVMAAVATAVMGVAMILSVSVIFFKPPTGPNLAEKPTSPFATTDEEPTSVVMLKAAGSENTLAGSAVAVDAQNAEASA